jgi:hypothetical protein
MHAYIHTYIYKHNLPKGGALAGLAHASYDLVSQVCAQRLTQSDCRCALALTQWCRGNASNTYITPIFYTSQALENIQPDLGLGGSMLLKLFGIQSESVGDLCDGERVDGLCHVDIRWCG